MKKPKLTTQERNQLIFERQKNGEDVRAIANEYRISVGMVKRIVQHILHKQAQDKESQAFLTTIREANDLNMMWNRARLLNAINHTVKVQNLLNKHFYPDAEEISLRQLMDWCLPEVTNESGDFIDYLPVFAIRGFGTYAVTDLINYTEDAGLGAAFLAEWVKRRDALRKKFRKEEKRRPLY